MLKPTRAGLFGAGGIFGPRKDGIADLDYLDEEEKQSEGTKDATEDDKKAPSSSSSSDKSNKGSTTTTAWGASVVNPLAMGQAEASGASKSQAATQTRRPPRPEAPMIRSGSGVQLLIGDEVTWEKGADPSVPRGTIGRLLKLLKASPFFFLPHQHVHQL